MGLRNSLRKAIFTTSITYLKKPGDLVDQKYNTLKFWCATVAFFTAAACLVTSISSWRSLQSRLDGTAASALLNAEHLFTRSATDLEKLYALRTADCTEKSVSALRDAVYNSVLPVREIGVINNGRLNCTNFGPTDVDMAPQSESMVPGINLSISANSVMPGNRSLFLYRMAEKNSGINAAFNAPILGEFERGFEFSAFGTQQLFITNVAKTVNAGGSAGLIYAIGQTKLDLQNAFWKSRAESKLFPIAAEVAVAPAAFWAEWRGILPNMLLAFVLLGALVGLITSLWIKRGGPSRLRYQRALQRKEFVIHYQPIVDAKTTHIIGIEALLRWQHPTSGLLRAAEFAALFDDETLLMPLTEFVIASVEIDLKKIEGLGNVWCSVNVPPPIFDGVDLINLLAKVIKRISVSRLRLEITERSPMSTAAENCVREIRSLGIAVGMDDIGTGHSNLDQLQRLVYDFIKIDGMLVRGITSTETISPVVTSLIALGHKIKTEIIAEGVETQAQADALAQAGVAELQGYLYGRAEPIEEIVLRLKAQQAGNAKAASATVHSIYSAGSYATTTG
jgi:sensor c-di-GMP phosphodiesterase-like protein